MTAAAIAGPELTPSGQALMVARLRQQLQQADPGAAVELIETHISFVLVTPDCAYKFKKALDLGFLDFSTLERRRHCCDEELRLNRRLAPDLYLDTVPVTGSVDAPQLSGPGTPIDVAVRMRTFDQDGLWDRLAARGALQPAHVDELAALLCRFHQHAAVAGPGSRFGTPEAVRAPMLDNLAVLARLRADASSRAALASLQSWEAGAFTTLAPVFARRHAEGRVVEGHGDLHLGNVAQVAGRTTVFDGIDFSEALRWIDVMSELAFMAMDLQQHGLPALAHRFVNACLECSGDYDGVRVLRYHLVYRALVRAKVAAIRAAQSDAGAVEADRAVQGYLQLAATTAQAARPALIVTHGLSGSGKSTLAQSLVEATGAVRIRADVERKRLFGLAAAARSGSPPGAGLYTADATDATHDRLREAAACVLAGGYPAVLDATFLQRRQRDVARALAASLGVPFVILDVQADVATLRERVRRRAERGGDASEADLSVLEAQQRIAEPLAGDELVAVHRHTTDGTSAAPDWAALLAQWVHTAGR